MGAAVGTACYESASEAADVYYSSALPQITDKGVIRYEFGPGGWSLNTYENGASGLVLTSSVAASTLFPECSNIERFQDGMTLGWGVFMAGLAAWWFVMMQRTAR